LFESSLKGIVSERLNKARTQERRDRCFLASAITQQFEQAKQFSLVYQQLLESEFKKAEELVSGDLDHRQIYYPDNLKVCRCRFFRTQRLPCRHIFSRYLRQPDYITDADWIQWKMEVENKSCR
jgi:hypothetical protein